MIKINKSLLISHLVCITAGVVLGYFLFHNNPVASVVKEKTETTNTKKAEGKPDTSSTVKSKTSIVKVKNEGTTNFEVKKDEAGITKVTVAKSDSDKIDLEIEHQYPEKTIVRVDTITTEKVVTVNETKTEIVSEMPAFLLGGGIKLYHDNETIKTLPFVHLTANSKLWFFVVSIEGKALFDSENLQLKIKPEIEGKLSVQL